MKLKSPASDKRQGLDNDFDNSNSSTITHTIPKVIGRLETLSAIATKWVDKGCYETPGRALQALIGGYL